MQKPSSALTVLIMLLAILLVPPLVFLLVGISSDMPASSVLSALIEQYTQKKRNLLAIGSFACLPLLLIPLVLWLYKRFGGAAELRPVLSWSGFLGILLVTLWVNFEFWPDYLPSRVYPGFPHGLEFVIGPLFFAPAAMVMCMLVAWLVYRKSG
jgi:hypothetical protein